MKKNRELELLRAVGIIFVIIAHLPFLLPATPDWLNAINRYASFWPGVDIFFAVSGFVITRSIREQLSTSNPSEYWSGIKAFWIKRFFRLIPASWFWLLASIFFAITLNQFDYFRSVAANVKETIAQFFYLQNWFAYYCSHGFTECGINGKYWSLSLEEQFYLAMPILFFFIKKHRIVFCLALIALQFPMQRELGSAFWYVRTDAILWGVIIAIATEGKMWKAITPTLLKNPILRIIIVTVLISSIPVLGLGAIATFHTGLIAIVCGVIVWIASYNQGLLSLSIKNNRVVLWVASRSYSLYLIHGIAFRLASHILRSTYGRALDAGDTIAVSSLSFVLCVVMADLSYRFLEANFIARGKLASEKWVVPPISYSDISRKRHQ